jgi:hypothetical protein
MSLGDRSPCCLRCGCRRPGPAGDASIAEIITAMPCSCAIGTIASQKPGTRRHRCPRAAGSATRRRRRTNRRRVQRPCSSPARGSGDQDDAATVWRQIVVCHGEPPGMRRLWPSIMVGMGHRPSDATLEQSKQRATRPGCTSSRRQHARFARVVDRMKGLSHDATIARRSLVLRSRHSGGHSGRSLEGRPWRGDGASIGVPLMALVVSPVQAAAILLPILMRHGHGVAVDVAGRARPGQTLALMHARRDASASASAG